MKDFSKQLADVVFPKLQKELAVKNAFAVPRLKKIVVNVGIGTRIKVTKDYSDIEDNIAAITGQKPVVSLAKKAISNFKLRENSPNGLRVTLRKKRMLDFYNRMVNVAFPRIRDFQGFDERSFDGKGNYSVGIQDVTIFPEVKLEDLGKMHGLSICIVTTSGEDKGSKALLKALNFPFKKTKKLEARS